MWGNDPLPPDDMLTAIMAGVIGGLILFLVVFCLVTHTTPF